MKRVGIDHGVDDKVDQAERVILRQKREMKEETIEERAGDGMMYEANVSEGSGLVKQASMGGARDSGLSSKAAVSSDLVGQP